MTAHILEWLTLFARWFHFVAGVAWIGASFYFIWVENALERKSGIGTAGIQGHLWALHGGGFYYLEKYNVAPSNLPKTLHWFKWEAYSTWFSGMILMTLVYYVSAQAWLISPDADITSATGIAISVGSLTLALGAYVALCSTPLLSRPALMSVIGLAASIVSVFLLREVFTPRAAMIHLGAMIGTIMVGNVLLVIIPGQKHLVEMVKTGGKTDVEMVRRGSLRSTHNNYLTLPVLFIMISSHHPSSYAGDWWWLTISLLFAGSVLIRHFFNLKNRGKWAWKWAFAGTLILVLAIAATAPGLRSSGEGGDAVSFSEIRTLVDKHCTSCHSDKPTDDLFKFPPLGFVLHSDELIRTNADSIYQRTVVDKTMPFNNETGMTEDERSKLGSWYLGLSAKSQ